MILVLPNFKVLVWFLVGVLVVSVGYSGYVFYGTFLDSFSNAEVTYVLDNLSINTAYDRISKGQSYTVKSNEFVDVFYIYDEAGCGVDEAFNTKTSSCEPLESFSFSCVNGEFNEQLNGCIVEPIITQGEVTCPEGYTKEVVDGGQACLTSNPDVVQIEPNENYAVSNKQGILGAGLVGDTIGFVVFIALLFIVYLMYRGKKK